MDNFNKAKIEKEFNKLKIAWKAETMPFSSSCKIVSNENYQQIIGLGQSVVPFIIEDIKINGPDHWDYALRKLTNSNPIPKNLNGNIKEICNEWVKFYEEVVKSG